MGYVIVILFFLLFTQAGRILLLGGLSTILNIITTGLTNGKLIFIGALFYAILTR